MNVIVFSKDRAMQLDAFLRSYDKYVFPTVPVKVLYLATSDRHAVAYSSVFDRHKWVKTYSQGDSFKVDVLRLVPTTGNVVFFVDDQIFIRRWFVFEEPGLSLRLGLNLTRNYNSGNAPQEIPPHETLSDGRIRWLWTAGTLAWGYPLSVDGHVYDAVRMRDMLESIDFHSPNTLESALQRFIQTVPPYGTCYRESRTVNVPWNLVQSDWSNRHSSEGHTVDEMLTLWEQGYQIDLRYIDGNESVHQEFPLMLEARC